MCFASLFLAIFGQITLIAPVNHNNIRKMSKTFAICNLQIVWIVIKAEKLEMRGACDLVSWEFRESSARNKMGLRDKIVFCCQ